MIIGILKSNVVQSRNFWIISSKTKLLRKEIERFQWDKFWDIAISQYNTATADDEISFLPRTLSFFFFFSCKHIFKFYSLIES